MVRGTARKIAFPSAVLAIFLTASFLTIIIVWVAESHLTVGYDTLYSNNHPGYLPSQVHPKINFDGGIYATDPLCGGCYHAIANPEENLRCGYLMFNSIQAKGISLTQAATEIASQYNGCVKCRPDACSNQDKVYWRYDSKHHAPSIVSSRAPQLTSIPSTQRIPANATKNLQEYFSEPNHNMPPARYLFDYNPSIIVLPSTLETTQFTETPVYLASFRVSTQQSCFHPSETVAMYGGSWDRKPPIENYLGLALLRQDLSILHDVVVDVKASGVFENYAEDFRLFVLNEQVYLGTYDYVAPISISHSTLPGRTKLEGYQALENLFPSNLQVQIRSFPSCPVCQNKHCGKNLNYFSTTHDKKVWVEQWPLGPRVTQQMNLEEPCSLSRTNKNEPIVYSDAAFQPPPPAWYTMEEVLIPSMGPPEALFTRERGGACCIPIEDPRTGNELLVGVAHTKIPKFGKRSGKRLPALPNHMHNNTVIATNQYLSLWYAFQPTPPFPIVAKSGLFCLGYPGNKEQEGYPLIQTTTWKTIVFGGLGLEEKTPESSLVLDCPRIHFVSGLSKKANDPDRVLVAYGVNDCFSRIIEIEKKSIVDALFSKK